MGGGETKTHRRAIVHDVQAVALKPEFPGEAVNYPRQIVEGIVEFIDARHGAVAESGIIGRYYVITVGDSRDKVPEHLRGCGKPVQEQDGRRVLATGLTVKNVEAVDFHGFVQCFCCGNLCGHRRLAGAGGKR